MTKEPTTLPVIVAGVVVLRFCAVIWLERLAVAVMWTATSVPSVGSKSWIGGVKAWLKLVRVLGTVLVCVPVSAF